MARKRTLLEILQDYRSEIRASGNPAHNNGVRDDQVRLLQRTQERLYDEYEWRFMEVERFIELQAGQRLYAPPDDVAIDRILSLEVRYGGDWITLHPGVRDCDYAMYDSYTDERGWPVTRWQVYEDEQIEVWPIPSTNASRYDDPAAKSREGQLRVQGIRDLRPFVADDDRADLDHRLISLYAAAETLAANGAADAEAKARAAQRRLNSLRGNMSHIDTFKMFGASEQRRTRKAPIPTVHYRTDS